VRVLLVEDDRDQLRLLQLLVENAGHVAVTCATMAAARAEAPCDVALIDRHLPDGDGTELARELEEGDREMGVYLLTGDETSAGEPGPRVLVKPLHLRDLLRILARHGTGT
jgi:DNA-binding response OmpR family regulator